MVDGAVAGTEGVVLAAGPSVPAAVLARVTAAPASEASMPDRASAPPAPADAASRQGSARRAGREQAIDRLLECDEAKPFTLKSYPQAHGLMLRSRPPRVPDPHVWKQTRLCEARGCQSPGPGDGERQSSIAMRTTTAGKPTVLITMRRLRQVARLPGSKSRLAEKVLRALGRPQTAIAGAPRARSRLRAQGVSARRRDLIGSLIGQEALGRLLQ